MAVHKNKMSAFTPAVASGTMPVKTESRDVAMSINLAEISKEEMDRINIDLAASAVAFKERYNMPVVAEMVERQQLEHLRTYFRERVMHYRGESHKFSRLPYEPKQK